MEETSPPIVVKTELNLTEHIDLKLILSRPWARLQHIHWTHHSWDFKAYTGFKNFRIILENPELINLNNPSENADSFYFLSWVVGSSLRENSKQRHEHSHKNQQNNLNTDHK